MLSSLLECLDAVSKSTPMRSPASCNPAESAKADVVADAIIPSGLWGWLAKVRPISLTRESGVSAK